MLRLALIGIASVMLALLLLDVAALERHHDWQPAEVLCGIRDARNQRAASCRARMDPLAASPTMGYSVNWFIGSQGRSEMSERDLGRRKVPRVRSLSGQRVTAKGWRALKLSGSAVAANAENGKLTIRWSKNRGPATSRVEFTAPTAMATTAVFGEPGNISSTAACRGTGEHGRVQRRTSCGRSGDGDGASLGAIGQFHIAAREREDNMVRRSLFGWPAVHDGVGLKRAGQDPDRSHERRME